MITIFGGIGRLRVPTSFRLSGGTYWFLLYSPLTRFCSECEFSQLWLIREGCMHPCLLALLHRLLSRWTWSHVTDFWRCRTSARTHIVSSLSWYVFIYTIQPAHTFPLRCEFAQPWLHYSIRIALWIWLIYEGCMHPCLLVRSLRVLSCWTSSHDNNIWRYRTSARTPIFRLSACTYWFILQLAHTLPLWMRVCPALIVLQHSNCTLNMIDLWRLHASMLTRTIAWRAVLLNFITW